MRRKSAIVDARSKLRPLPAPVKWKRANSARGLMNQSTLMRCVRGAVAAPQHHPLSRGHRRLSGETKRSLLNDGLISSYDLHSESCTELAFPLQKRADIPRHFSLRHSTALQSRTPHDRFHRYAANNRKDRYSPDSVDLPRAFLCGGQWWRRSGWR